MMIEILFDGLMGGLGFLLVGFFILNFLCLIQEKGELERPDLMGRGLRRWRSSYFYRGSVRGGASNAEWFVTTLLTAHKEVQDGKPRRKGGYEVPPEWETYYPQRKVSYDLDKSGTTVKLSTADMISVRWNLPLAVCMELGLFADLIVKDFILYWYNESISKDVQFPDDVRCVLQNVLGRLGDRVLSINLPMFLLCDMTYVLRHHLRWFSELRIRARKRCHPVEEFDRMSQEDRNSLILEEFRRAGHLHPACSLTGQTEDPRTIAYVRSITCELLVRLLPEEDYQCAALRHLVREVLTCNVLVPALESITPDVFNSAILAALTGVSQEDSHHHQQQQQQQHEDDGEEEEEEAGLEGSQNHISFHQQDEDDRRHIGFGDKDARRSSTVSTLGSMAEQKEEDDFLKQGPLSSTTSSSSSSSSTHQESISFIEEANLAMRKEEAQRLSIELHATLAECVATFTSNPDVPLNSDRSEARQILRVLDNILSHGLLPSNEPTIYAGNVVCESWWEFIRHVSELLPSTSMTIDAVDSAADVFTLLGHNKDDDQDDGMGVEDEEGKQHQKSSSRKKHSGSQVMFKGFDLDRDIFQPGHAWIAMALKHKLLAPAMQALLKEKTWVDTHYEQTAAIRNEKLIPTLATLNGIEFDFNLDKFWSHATKIRKQLEDKGVKSSKHEKLRRMRKKLAGELSKRIKMKSGTKSRPEHAIVALQDRVGPITASIDSFTIKKEKSVRASTYVEYVIRCSLTRRIDGQTSTWTIFRRFNRFYELHAALKAKYGSRFDIDIPKKTGLNSVFSSHSVTFINKRKEELADYVKQILDHPTVCDSEEVLTFLSPETQEEFAASFLNSNEELQELHFHQNHDDMSELDHNKDDQNCISNNSKSSSKEKSSSSSSSKSKEMSESFKKTTRAMASRLKRPSLKPQEPKDPKIDPYELRIAEGHIYRLAQEVFEFHELGLFRRNLIAMMRSIVSMLFQGTAHRWLKDNYTRSASADLLQKLLASVRELLWPNGEFMETEEEQEISPEELARMAKTREDCLEELIKAIPPGMIRFLGLERSHACCRKLHEFLNHPSLIHNLVFTTMDLLLLRIFPDLPLKDVHNKKYDL